MPKLKEVLKSDVKPDIDKINSENEFNLIYSKYKNIVLKIIRQYLSDNDYTEEILQEVFIIVYKNFHNLKNKLSFLSWIKTIVKNLCSDIYRSNNYKVLDKFVSLDELGDRYPIDQDNSFYYDQSSLEVDEKYILISENLKSLPLKYRQVLYLCDIEDYTYKDISKLLNIEITTIKARLAYARNMLRKSVKKKHTKYYEG